MKLGYGAEVICLRTVSTLSCQPSQKINSVNAQSLVNLLFATMLTILDKLINLFVFKSQKW